MVLSPLPGVIPPTAPLAPLWEPALQSQYVDIVYCQLVYQIIIVQRSFQSSFSYRSADQSDDVCFVVGYIIELNL